VRRHLLRMFESATIREICRDAGRAEAVIADWCVNSHRNGAPADHAPGVRLRHWLFEQRGRVVAGRRAEKIALAILGNAGGVNVGAQFLGERMMARHLMMLAAFLVQPQLPAGAFRSEILDLHLQRRIYAREGIGEGGDECPVAPITQRVGRNGVDKLAPFFGIQHRSLAGFHNVLRATHGRGRVHRHDLAGDQPIEQHPHRSELLLHVRCRMGQLARLYIGRDVMRPDRRQCQAAFLAPGKKRFCRKFLKRPRSVPETGFALCR
jgi:hypothetical protein